MASQLGGSCLCGDVRFEVAGDFEAFYLCHCKYCQKDTGSVHAANLFSQSAQLNWLKGADSVKTYQLPNTLHTKSFCANCGSALPYQSNKLHLTVVPAGSLDVSPDIAPTAKLFMESRVKWACQLQNLPEFEKLPD